MADASQVELKNNFESSQDSQFLSFVIQACNPAESKVECASSEEIDRYVDSHAITLTTINSFVDYSEVDPGKGPVKQMLNALAFMNLKSDTYQ